MRHFPALSERLKGHSAAEFAERLCYDTAASETLPVWADSGTSTTHDANARGHRLSAAPSRVVRAKIEELGPGALVSWLREQLPAPQDGFTAVGLSYDAGRGLEQLPSTARDDLDLPDLVIATYPAYVSGPTEMGPWRVTARDLNAAEALVDRLAKPVSPPRPALPDTLGESGTQEGYHAGLLHVLNGIARGDFYQTNVARRMEAAMGSEMSPLLYLRMRRFNPAAFGVLWALGDGNWIASSSPECLLDWNPETRLAKSFPIKGTRRRDESPDADEALRRELQADPKERAEHVMIVDLVRNDLGRVAEVGSVKVDALFETQTLPTVHHLVSTVSATVRPECGLPELLGALFPGGSITGAPKIAAMHEIETVEPVRRSFYTGSIGFIEPSGQATFNILIRTCIATRGRVYYYTGGGIVADSTPRREWEETVEKAAALITTLRDQ